MNNIIDRALITGVERLSGWADLLDEINVYPVADGDTGRNLIISLSPLLQHFDNPDDRKNSLLLAARGNSGNIAVKFFTGFISARDNESLPAAAKLGRDLAWGAVRDPRKGTILTVFDALSEILEKEKSINEQTVPTIIHHLENAVRSTTGMLPRLKEANVIDSGALGMFVFFEGFFNSLFGVETKYRSVTEIFKDNLSVSKSFHEEQESGFCVDFVMNAGDDAAEKIKDAIKDDDSAIILEDKDYIKVHFHTDDKDKIKKYIQSDIVKWSDDDLGSQIREFKHQNQNSPVHVMTDAAGSVTQNDVKNLGLTLLNSYILTENRCVPETHFDPEELYGLMSRGVKLSTSQASDFERHQHYISVLSRFSKVLYLCVGSVYTGNYNIATDWKNRNDADNRMTVIDSGAASGKLGLAAIAAARYSNKSQDADAVVSYAEKAIKNCNEYIFLEKLHFLAAGGRMSKTGAFFGDILNVKPIISPMPHGAEKVGVARSRKDQMKFLFDKLSSDLKPDSNVLIMLEYTDNVSWVNSELREKISENYPDAEIISQPLSLTTGVHTGPGTWGIAYIDLDILEK